jgi:hypothetical protein
MAIDTVFLVEQRNSGEDRMTYWAKVYASRATARKGVEYWAPRAGAHELSWTEGGYGELRAESPDGVLSWNIVPLAVHPDGKPEEHGAPVSGR